MNEVQVEVIDSTELAKRLSVSLFRRLSAFAEIAQSGENLHKLALELEAISRKRRVPKPELIRLALKRLFEEIKGGQLDLPLGLERT